MILGAYFVVAGVDVAAEVDVEPGTMQWVRESVVMPKSNRHRLVPSSRYARRELHKLVSKTRKVSGGTPGLSRGHEFGAHEVGYGDPRPDSEAVGGAP